MRSPTSLMSCVTTPSSRVPRPGRCGPPRGLPDPRSSSDSATSSMPLRLTRRVRIHARGGRARPIVRTTHSAILDSLSQSGLVAQQ
jgi:hypothetical protein